MASGEMSPAEFTDFLSRVCSLLASHSVDGSIHFVCMDWRHLGELIAAGKQAYSELKNVCVWTKDNAGMGSLYRSQHELVFVFKPCDPHHGVRVDLVAPTLPATPAQRRNCELHCTFIFHGG
jgi:hypothetical protein